MMKKIELLSPAGNFEKLKASVHYGANAVYLAGKEYGLRSFADNFSSEEIAEAVRYAHKHGVKVYVTINVFAHQEDLDGISHQIPLIAKAGADAVIVSDPGVFDLVKRLAPKLPVHISTQSNVTNSQACRFWHHAGAKRIVLARELTFRQIKEIRAAVPKELELEVFVHGSMCVAYSGRCLLSAYFTGRDANRGACTQSCRWPFAVVEESRPDTPLPITEDERGSYLFSSKDLCMIDHIPELIEAGIDSLKIEGRMKGILYAAVVTKTYRAALDAYERDPRHYVSDPQWREDLNRTVHRAFDTGFFFDKPAEDAKITHDESYIREANIAGIVLSYDPIQKRAYLEQKNKISEGDFVELISPTDKNIWIQIEDLKDENSDPIRSTPHPGMRYSIKMHHAVAEHSLIRVTTQNQQPSVL